MINFLNFHPLSNLFIACKFKGNQIKYHGYYLSNCPFYFLKFSNNFAVLIYIGMNTSNTLFEKHQATLHAALQALGSRTYYSPYPENPRAYAEAQRIEEENDYSDAMESMERKYWEGQLDALTHVYSLTYGLAFAIAERKKNG